MKALKKIYGSKKYLEMKGKAGRESIKKLQKKYGLKRLRLMALEGKRKLRKNESRKLENKHLNFFTNEIVYLHVENVNLSKHDKLKKIKLPGEMSPMLAEEIGIHLGNGCLSFNKRYFSFKTNKTEEDYMTRFLFPLYKELYNIDLKLMRLKSVVGFEIYSSAIFEYKNKVLGISYGEKVENIEVPKKVLDTKNKEIYAAFIRGLFDTDGCVNIIKTKRNYPVVTFTVKSEKLIRQVKEMLLKLGFIPHAGKWKIDLNGRVILEKWIKEIGSNNPKNLIRLQQASSSARIE